MGVPQPGLLALCSAVRHQGWNPSWGLDNLDLDSWNIHGTGKCRTQHLSGLWSLLETGISSLPDLLLEQRRDNICQPEA